MNITKSKHSEIRKQTLCLLFTPQNGRLPILCDIMAVFIWLCTSLGVDALVESLPFDIPMPIADILRMSVTLPLFVGVVRCIAGMPESGAAEIFAPFESVTAYTDAWKSALTFPIAVLKHPEMLKASMRAVWHIIPILLSSGLWLFVFIPYHITLCRQYAEKYNNAENKNNINTIGGTPQWTTKENSI